MACFICSTCFFFSFDNPSSLAAVLQPDPEEILLNLGFGGAGDLSLLQTVPSRFLQQPSTLSGIDVEAFQKTLLISEVMFHFILF